MNHSSNHIDQTDMKDNPAEKPESEAAELQRKLVLKFPTLWEVATEDDLDAAFAFAEEYMLCLSSAKTERMFVSQSIEGLEEIGFVPLSDKEELKAGDKVYASIRGKGLMAAVIGGQPAEAGFNILGAHVDSPAPISSRCLFMRTVSWLYLKRTIMAASKNISGRRSRWRCTDWPFDRMARRSRSIWEKKRTTRSSRSMSC